MPYLRIFLCLQALDLVTTLIGFRFGAGEASPFIRALMHLGPAAGVFLSKVVACALAGVCIWLGKHHLVRWANYWYCGLVLWNFGVILLARHTV